MTISPENLPPIRTETDLLRRWQQLMGDGGFGMRSLWLIYLDDEGMQGDLIAPIDGVPMLPDPREVRGIAESIALVRKELGVAEIPMLLSRPGPSYITEGDRLWAMALTQALRDQRPRWPIHLATCDRVQVFAPDDLVAA